MPGIFCPIALSVLARQHFRLRPVLLCDPWWNSVHGSMHNARLSQPTCPGTVNGAAKKEQDREHPDKKAVENLFEIRCYLQFDFELWTSNSELKTQNPEQETQNSKFKIQNSKLNSPTHITTHVSTPTSALLIFSEPHYPGWQATVNGQPTPILRANYILRAVPLPAGEHTVELIFRPTSFTLGAIISIVTIIAVISIIRHYID